MHEQQNGREGLPGSVDKQACMLLRHVSDLGQELGCSKRHLVGIMLYARAG